MKYVPVLITIVLSIVVLSCKEKKNTKTTLPIKIKTMIVETSDQTKTHRYVGVIEAKKSAFLSFTLGGTVKSIYAKEGEKVSKGELLATLDGTSARNALAASRSALTQAEDGYKRMKQLYERQSIPEIRMVEMKSKLQQARSAYEISKKNVEDCSVFAPFSGIIGKKHVETGENVAPGSPVLTLLETKTVRARISVPESEISYLSQGDSSFITVQALGDEKFVGGEIEKHSNGDLLTHSYEAWVNVDNSKGKLLPGMVCNVTIILEGDNPEKEITLPIRTVQENSSGEKFVWKVEGEKVKRCKVTIGNMVDNNVLITSGVSVGDKIVVEGYQKISEGSKIVEQ